MLDWLGKQACHVGLHSFEWTYPSACSCEQVGTCVRPGCGAVATRQRHMHGDWTYLAEGACERVRRCFRCGDEILGKARHLWGEWQYGDKLSCTRRRYCARNREHFEDERRPKHPWGERVYVADGSCKRVRACLRNPEHQEFSIDHVWSAAAPISAAAPCTLISHCARCPDGQKMVGTIHAYLPPERRQDGWTIRRCSRCPHVERIYEKPRPPYRPYA